MARMTLVPYERLTDKERHQLEAQADAEREAGRDGVMYWMVNTTAERRARRAMAARMLTASVFAQAACLGLVKCGHCGDQGCVRCEPVTFA